ncbi:hypothetical protein [Streptomyces virginiae]|uniref:Uncharacterized protein n=1 Tax=Streptomyces virginiae TaxID=1961 RepID=A0ABZ1TJ43_STRVG|nr:hypothetical protein [Streptomyces virginiae]
MCTPPLEAALRVLWPHVVRSPHQRRAALSLDACARELVFIGGPLLVLPPHTLAAAERHHAEYLSTMTPAALAGGSLIGGLLYGRRTWPGTPTRQLRTLGSGFAVGSLPGIALAGLVPAATAPAAAAGVAAGGAAAGSVVLPPLHPCCRPPSGGGYSAEPPTGP